MKIIVKRIENWNEGTIKCLHCGKELHLYWNGGELDKAECCGLEYETRNEKVDLIITRFSPSNLFPIDWIDFMPINDDDPSRCKKCSSIPRIGQKDDGKFYYCPVCLIKWN